MERGEPKEEDIPRMLAEAWERLDGNQPMQALELVRRTLKLSTKSYQNLQQVIQAIRQANGGDEGAVLKALTEAKEKHRKVVASPTRPGPNWELLQPPPNMHLLNEEGSLLAEQGDGQRAQIIQDAAMDGSSFVCQECGGLVPVHRMEAHFNFWCGQDLVRPKEQEREKDEGKGKEKEKEIY